MLLIICYIYFGEIMGVSLNGRFCVKLVLEGILFEKGGDINGFIVVIKFCVKMDYIKIGGILLN